jgi:protein gp37
MAENSTIEWTDATWSPWEGCTKVGPGCDHCYAESINNWLRKGENWGPGAPRREYSDAHWQKPLKWNAAAAANGERMRVFPSVCDPFDNEVSNTLRSKFLGLMWRTPWLDWLLLTKRIGNVAPLMMECTEPSQQWGLPPNAWLGITAVDQTELDRDAPKLLRIPAKAHFLSYEPALGPVDTSRWLGPQCDNGSVPGPGGAGGVPCPRCGGASGHCLGLSWVIAGGESGRGARPAHPDWFRALRDQCAEAGVPFLFKQWGEWLPPLHDTHATNEFSKGMAPIRVGKKLAGRLLDGVEHNGVPV